MADEATRSTTTYLFLIKPEYEESADVGEINYNMDLLDAAFHTLDLGVKNKTAIAPLFATGTANSPGDYVTYTDNDGTTKLYLLPSGHTAGTSWENTTKTVASVADALKNLVASDTSILSVIAPVFDQAVANDSGTYVTNNGLLYYLPDGHTANAPWATTTATLTSVGAALKNTLEGAGAQIDDTAGDGNIVNVWSASKLFNEFQSVYAVLATKFDQDVANDVGAYVEYEHELYLLPNGHSSGTTWANTTKTKKTIGEVFEEVGASVASIINDSAGAGNTSRTWSASKLTSQMNNILLTFAPEFSQGVANNANTFVVYGGEVYFLPNGHNENDTWENTTKVKKTISVALHEISAVTISDDGEGNVTIS